MSDFKYQSSRVDLESDIATATTNARFWLVFAVGFLVIAGIAHFQSNGTAATGFALLMCGAGMGMSAAQRAFRSLNEKRLETLPKP